MSASLIGWIISIIFVVILFGGFSVGFWRGFKRSTASLIFSLAGLVLAFFITPPITDAILKIKVGFNGTQVPLYNILLEYMLSVGDVKTMINSNPNIEVLVANLPSAICNAVIFILVTLVVEFVVYLIFKVICVAVIKDKDGKCVGGLIGLVKAFVVTVVACMPLASVVGLANKMVSTNDYGITTVAVEEVERRADDATDDENQGEEEGDANQTEVQVVTKGLARDYVPDSVVIVIQGFENNFLTKCTNFFGLDDKMFDYYGSVKVDNGKVVVRQEIENLYEVADFGYQLSKYGLKNVDYTKIDYDRVEASVSRLADSDLFKKVVANSVADIIENYSKYSFMSGAGEFQDILDDIGGYLSTVENKYEYFRNDLNKITQTLKTFGKAGIVNEVLALEEPRIPLIADILTKEANIEAFESGLNSIMKVNMLQDSISTIAGKVIEKIKLDIDNIGVDVRDFTEEDWTAVEASLVSVVKDFGSLAQMVDVSALVEDATILLDKDKNYNIDAITTTFGRLIDEIRANKLLQTADEKSIVDRLIENNNLALTATTVYANDGKELEIKGYQDAFEFIAPSLKLARDEGIYDIINGAQETEDVIVSLAELVSKEGNEKLLGNIVLPLYQIDFTNTLIVEQITEAVSGNFIDLTLLENYEDWKNDLNDISNLLINLNTLKLDKMSYLDILLGGSYKIVFNNIKDAEVDKIILPILTAKSTYLLKKEIFGSLKEEIEKYTAQAVVLTTENVSFTGNESQANEVVEIFKKFVFVNRTLREGQALKDADHKLVAELFETMKINAYRTEGELTEEGMFKDVYVKLVNSLKASYANEIAAIEANSAALEKLGVENLSEENYNKLSITKLLELLDEAVA